MRTRVQSRGHTSACSFSSCRALTRSRRLTHAQAYARARTYTRDAHTYSNREAHARLLDSFRWFGPSVFAVATDERDAMLAQLLLSALSITTQVLRPGGTFVAKIFRGKDVTLLYAQIKIFFPDVYCAKPKSSRNSSVEAFVVARVRPPLSCKSCRTAAECSSIGAGLVWAPRINICDESKARFQIGLSPRTARDLVPYVSVKLMLMSARCCVSQNFSPPADFDVGAILQISTTDYECDDLSSVEARVVVPFVACGDLSGYDADQNYPLHPLPALLSGEAGAAPEAAGAASYVYHEPRQKPTTPAYRAYLEAQQSGRKLVLDSKYEASR
eukprot:3798937-Pleurochrysis_carterae.AAC.2